MLLGKPDDSEENIEYVLRGLSNDYKMVVNQIEGRDMSLSTKDTTRKQTICKEFFLRK